MGWQSDEEREQARDRVLALTPEQRASLTWKEAWGLVLCDTLAMAGFRAMERSGKYTPWQALARLWYIEEDGKDE